MNRAQLPSDATKRFHRIPSRHTIAHGISQKPVSTAAKSAATLKFGFIFDKPWA